MPRRIRGPVAGQLVEVTTRTFHSTLLLRPSPTINDIIIGVIARAQRLYGMTVCAPIAMGNHIHLLLVPDSAQQLSSFMQFVNANIARKVGRLHGWSQKFWGGRHKPIPVSDEEEKQVERLAYILSHGAKENLVRRPHEWPGVNAIDAFLSGKLSLYGQWHDQTAESRARRRGEKIRPRRFRRQEILHLSPLPRWRHLSKEEIAHHVAGLLEHIQANVEAERASSGKRPLGVEAVLSQNPRDKPLQTKTSPAPLFHAATKRVFEEMLGAYRRFVAAYRQASLRLRSGELDVEFPPGSFPPRLAFVPEVDPSPV